MTRCTEALNFATLPATLPTPPGRPYFDLNERIRVEMAGALDGVRRAWIDMSGSDQIPANTNARGFDSHLPHHYTR